MRNIETIGFIGLGVMGEPMCRNIAKKHNGDVVAFDINSSTLLKLADTNIELAESLENLIMKSDLILLSLPGGMEVEDVCLGPNGIINHLQDGQFVIDCSTAPPNLSRKIYERYNKIGVVFADSPVARTRQAALNGTLSIMVGAEPGIFSIIEPILSYMATNVVHCGKVGAGQVCKILNNMVLFQNIAALSEAIAIGTQAGVEVEKLFESISMSSGDSFALRNHGMKSILLEEYPTGAFSVNYALKDLTYALDLSKASGVVAEGGERINRLFRSAIEEGWGDNYHPIIKKVIENIKS